MDKTQAVELLRAIADAIEETTRPMTPPWVGEKIEVLAQHYGVIEEEDQN